MQVDMDVIRKLVEEKLLSLQSHPECNLLIANYTQRCQFESIWTETTRMCRGLILEPDGTVVSRPFPKFFNIEEHDGQRLPLLNWNQPFAASNKLDGSLGILYFVGDESRIATRGSFISEQAKRGTEILKRKYAGFPFPRHLTFLWEIVYPENRIVVDYGDMEDLILLDVLHTDGRSDENFLGHGPGMWAKSIGCPYADEAPIQTFEHVLSHLESGASNDEGVVIRFQDGTRAKAKFTEYKRLHKLLTGLNARHIWECMSNGDGLDEILERVPDEFYQWVATTRDGLHAAGAALSYEAVAAFERIYSEGMERKDFALQATQDKRLAPFMFRMFDKKPIEDLLWKAIRPEASAPFVTETQAV